MTATSRLDRGLWVISLMTVVLASHSTATAAQTMDACRRIALDPRPLWTNSGTLSLDGSSLIVVDPLPNQVARYSLSGDQLESFSPEDSGLGPSFRPRNIIAAGAHYELLVGDTLYEVAEEAGELKIPSGGKVLNLMSSAVGAQGSITGIFRLTLVDSDVLAFGHIDRGGGVEASGYLWLPRERPSDFELVYEVLPDDPARDLYLILDPILATAGGRGYFLAMEQPPAIYEYASGGPLRNVVQVPAEFSRRPDLPEKGGVAKVPGRYLALERSQSATALYAQGPFLYLLTRQPMSSSPASQWALFKIDPMASSPIVGKRILPTNAPHLLLAPGDEQWAVVERGTVVDLGYQVIKSALLIPAAWIENEDGPLSPSNYRPDICH